MMPEPFLRMVERRFPRPAVRRALRQTGMLRAANQRYADAARETLPIEEIAGPEPDVQDHSAPPEEWSEEALLETYELPEALPGDDFEADGDDYDDQFDHADETVEIVTRPRPATRPDYSRFVQAVRDKARPAARSLPRELPAALSRDECRLCGIPGFRGCAHQAPFVAIPPPERHGKGAYK